MLDLSRHLKYFCVLSMLCISILINYVFQMSIMNVVVISFCFTLFMIFIVNDFRYLNYDGNYVYKVRSKKEYEDIDLFFYHNMRYSKDIYKLVSLHRDVISKLHIYKDGKYYEDAYDILECGGKSKCLILYEVNDSVYDLYVNFL